MTTTSTLPLTAGSWALDPAHSTVGFTVRHLGLAKVRGRFDAFTTDVVIGNGLADTKVAATIDLSSVNTNNPDRDGHLQSSDFFDAASHPQMTFTSTSIEGSGEEYTMVGDLTINGVTRSVELDVEFFGTSVFPADQSTRAGFSASGQISRKDFGIEFNVPLGGDKVMIADKVAIELDVQLIAPGS